MSQTQVYSDTGQTAILELQRQGARLVRMRPDGKRPAFKWGGRMGRCLTARQAESWLRIGGRFALVPYSIGFTVIDVDAGPWQSLTAAHPPHAVIKSRKLWRRHLYYSDSESRPNANGRKLHGCHVDVRSGSGYAALWHPRLTLEAAESPRQGTLFPWWTIWPVEGAKGPPKTPHEPPGPSVGVQLANPQPRPGRGAHRRPTERRLPAYPLDSPMAGSSAGAYQNPIQASFWAISYTP